MYCIDFRVLLFLCLLNGLIEVFGAVNQGGLGGRGGSVKQSKSVYSGLSDANGGLYNKNRSAGLKAAPSTVGDTSRGLGLSAWGIIMVVVTVIVAGVAAYYVAIFYPLVCRKQGQYDIMELSAV